MNLIELKRALKQLRLGGIAAVLETRLHQAQAEPMAPIDLISCLVSDELTRRSDRLLERRRKEAEFRDPQVTLDNFDFNFNKKMNRSLVFRSRHSHFIAKHEDALVSRPAGHRQESSGSSHRQAAIQQGYRVLYRETHTLLNDIADATIDGTRKAAHGTAFHRSAAHHRRSRNAQITGHCRRRLLEIVMRRYERTSTLLTSNRPIDDWGKLLGDTAAVTAMLDRLLHHGHVLKCGPEAGEPKQTCLIRRKWGKKTQSRATSVGRF